MTIRTLWDGGYDFTLISYMEWEEAGRPIDYMKIFIAGTLRDRSDGSNPWHNVACAEDLAAAIHHTALGKYPDFTHARLYATPSP